MIWQSSLLMELIDAAIFLAALAVLVVFYNHRRAISLLHLSVQAATGEQLFKMLNAGRIDVAVYARWSGLQLVRNLGLEDIRDADPPFATKDGFAYLHNSHAKLIPKAGQPPLRGPV